MLNVIQAALRADKRIHDWRLTETRKRGVEWYFSGSVLDTARSVDTLSYSIAVYVDAGEGDARTRGAFSVSVHPTATHAELNAAIDRAVTAAAGMRNPWYPIPDPSGAPVHAQVASGFSGMPLESSMEGLRSALYGASTVDGASINSLELFLASHDVRIVNSRGLDVQKRSYRGFTEFIVNASAPGKDEIELYGDLEFSEPDDKRLRAAMIDKLTQAKDRLVAIPTPACDGLPVLFKGPLAADIYEYWFMATQAQCAYDKTAPFKLGDLVGTDGGRGDAIRLKAVPVVAGSPRSTPFDPEGTALGTVPCITDGRLEHLVGPLKYTHYLGLPATGDHPVFELDAGRDSLERLASEPHVEAAAFSDFFVDPTTGDFGGELRLGYRVEGGKRVPISGGSITGSMADNRGEIRLSKELDTFPGCRAPAACLIPKARIASVG